MVCELRSSLLVIEDTSIGYLASILKEDVRKVTIDKADKGNVYPKAVKENTNDFDIQMCWLKVKAVKFFSGKLC